MRGLRRKSMALFLVVMMVLMSFGGTTSAVFAEDIDAISGGPDLVIRGLGIDGTPLKKSFILLPWKYDDNGSSADHIYMNPEEPSTQNFTFQEAGNYQLQIRTTFDDTVYHESGMILVSVVEENGHLVVKDESGNIIQQGTSFDFKLQENQIDGLLIDPKGEALDLTSGPQEIGQIRVWKSETEPWYGFQVNQRGAFAMGGLDDGHYQGKLVVFNYEPTIYSPSKSFEFEIQKGKLVGGSDLLTVQLAETQVHGVLLSGSGEPINEDVAFVIYDEQHRVVANAISFYNGWFKLANLEPNQKYFMKVLQSFSGNYIGPEELIPIDLTQNKSVNLGNLNILKVAPSRVQMSVVFENPYSEAAPEIPLTFEVLNETTGTYTELPFPDGKFHTTKTGEVMLYALADGSYHIIGNDKIYKGYELEPFDIYVSNGFASSSTHQMDFGAFLSKVQKVEHQAYGSLINQDGTAVGVSDSSYGIVQLQNEQSYYDFRIDKYGYYTIDQVADGSYKAIFKFNYSPREISEPESFVVVIKDGKLVGETNNILSQVYKTQLISEVISPDGSDMKPVSYSVLDEQGQIVVYSEYTVEYQGKQWIKLSGLEPNKPYTLCVDGNEDFAAAKPEKFELVENQLVELNQIMLNQYQVKFDFSNNNMDLGYIQLVIINKLTGFEQYNIPYMQIPALNILQVGNLVDGLYEFYLVSQNPSKYASAYGVTYEANSQTFDKIVEVPIKFNKTQVIGQLKDSQNTLINQTGMVIIRQNGNVVKRVPTNHEGVFAIGGLTEGAYTASMSVLEDRLVKTQPVSFRINNKGLYTGKNLILRVIESGKDEIAPLKTNEIKAIEVTQTTVTLNWSEGSDDVAVKGYEIYRNNVLVGETDQLDYVVTGLTPNKAYTFTIKTIDTSGNKSYNSSALRISTLKDTIKPATITDLTASNTTRTSVELSWNASTDNVGIKQYEVYRNGTRIKTTTDTAYKVMNLSPNKSYTFEVYAVDTSGNRSSVSNAVFVKTNK